MHTSLHAFCFRFSLTAYPLFDNDLTAFGDRSEAQSEGSSIICVGLGPRHLSTLPQLPKEISSSQSTVSYTKVSNIYKIAGQF